MENTSQLICTELVNLLVRVLIILLQWINVLPHDVLECNYTIFLMFIETLQKQEGFVYLNSVFDTV
jgi:hypothetical protein